MISKNTMITIAGRPNVGKSTLTNALTGEKVAIVTPKPQTTRNRIFGVFTHGETQMVLLDTPGFHKARTRLGDYMVGIVKESVADVDAVALLVEPVDNIGIQEELLIKHIEAAKVPSVLVINKVDTIKTDQTLPIIDRYSRRFSFDAIVPISAITGDGIPQLLGVFEKYAREGPQLFPDGMKTDQPEKQIIAEIIREKLLICLDREIPHGTAVEITKFSEREESSDTGIAIIDVDATIYCEKQSHKGMIIGKNGVMLKKVGQMAREDIERFMGAKVFLQTWVKVKENWRDSRMMMKNFGYTN
ncbi:MAG: GTPase Era [Oscillospiraceae bacterium]|jgi:GTP-binding protein Era|nr:GTPase Era [Oscillospiraceae bacterium]